MLNNFHMIYNQLEKLQYSIFPKILVMNQLIVYLRNNLQLKPSNSNEQHEDQLTFVLNYLPFQLFNNTIQLNNTQSSNSIQFQLKFVIINLVIAMSQDIELEDWDASKSMKHANKETSEKIQHLRNKKDYHGMLQLISTFPNDKDTYLLKANTYLSLQKWEDVIRSCDIGLDLGEESQFWHYKGKALGKLGKHQEKVNCIRQAINLNSKIPTYHRNLGAAYYSLKQYQKAIECHNKAIQLQPKNPINYHNKGAALLRMKNYYQAIKEFDNALQRDDKLALSYSWKGDCYKQLGKFPDALQQYNKAYKCSGNEIYLKQKKAMQDKIGGQPTRKKFLGIF